MNLASYKQIWSVLVGQLEVDSLVIWVMLWEVNNFSWTAGYLKSWDTLER